MSITFPFIFPNLGFSFDTAGPSIENKDVTQQSASETTDCFECVVCLFFSFLSKIIYCTERVSCQILTAALPLLSANVSRANLSVSATFGIIRFGPSMALDG